MEFLNADALGWDDGLADLNAQVGDDLETSSTAPCGLGEANPDDLFDSFDANNFDDTNLFAQRNHSFGVNGDSIDTSLLEGYEYDAADGFTFESSLPAWETNQQPSVNMASPSCKDAAAPLTREQPAGSTKKSNDEVDRSTRKTRRRFPREAVQLLKGWLREHAANPYPTDREMDKLKKDTGLKRSQIRTWLANTRRRTRLPNTTPYASSSSTTQESCSTSSTGSTGETPSSDILTPFDRWRRLNAPDEPVPVSAIAHVLGFQPPEFYPDGTEKKPFTEYRNPTPSDALSVTVSGVTASLTNGLTATSGPSEFSFGPGRSHASSGRARQMPPPSRRRKVHHGSTKTPSSVRSSASRATQGANEAGKIYQCTFCQNAFKTKYDWQRHEKAIHLSPERWICAPFGPIQPFHDTAKTRICVFCNAPEPTYEHIETHDHSACAEKPLHKRSFYRKDHLRQHLRLFHKTGFNDRVMANWVQRSSNITSRCGFCDLKLSSWGDRVEHLAGHFESGLTMREWKGGYGFEEGVEAMVENMAGLDVLTGAKDPKAKNGRGGSNARGLMMPPPPPTAPGKSTGGVPPALEGLDGIGGGGVDDGGGDSLTPDPFALPVSRAEEIDELVFVGLSCG